MERKYKAFISYRHADLDSAVAKTLHTLIEQYHIPKSLRTGGEKKLGIVFRDEEELSATNDLTGKIYTALDNSEHLIVICTKATLQSPWVTKEVEHFLKNHDRDKAHIILAEGEPMEVFPRPLTHREFENGIVEVTEPMAVDIRAENISAVRKKLKTQVLRLFAAMLGCPYDSLVMREHRRKRHRFAAVVSVVLAVAIGFSSILLVKNRQIDRKNTELDSANTALEAKNEELDKKNSELDRKNEELEEKNAEILTRESELLTSNSEKAYKEGNNYAAIESAALALPTKNDPRPYYAPAEAALLTALSPFDNEDNYIMRDTVLEQTTPVENFRISADGSKLATIDLYSVVTIFDTVTGEVLNSIQLNTNTVYFSSSNVHMLSCTEANSVIVFDGYTVAAISFDTCDILWSHNANRAVSDFICPSDDTSTFAYVRNYFDDADKCENYELVFLSGLTGEVIGTSTFIDGSFYSKGNYLSTYFAGYVCPGTYNGRFSPDNSLFVTSFFAKGENDVYSIHYSVTDIEAGTSKVFCSYKLDDYYSSAKVFLMFFDTDSTIVSVRKCSDRDSVMLTERIDIRNGKIYWQLPFPRATFFSYSSTDAEDIFGFTSGPTGTTAYIILNDFIYSFDTSTGEFINSNKIASTVVDADIVNNSFVYVLDNGHYSEALLTSYGISDIGDSIDLGDTLHMRIWNGGPTALHGSQDYSDAGYLATVPAENPHCVVIKRVSVIEDLFPAEYTGLNDDGSYFSGNYSIRLKDGSLAIGPFYNDNAYHFKITDPDTNEVLRQFSLSSTFGLGDMLFTLDGKHLIYTDKYGNITHHSEDGTSEVLYETEPVLLTYGDVFVCELPALSASACLFETGNILSAVCAEDTLILWTNGENRREIPLPEDLTWLYKDDSSATFLMDISSDGSVFIADFTNDDHYIDRLAVYSTVSGKWSYIDTGDIPFCVGSLYFSEISSSFVLLDDNGTAHILDTSGKEFSAFSLELPTNSVSQLEFILDDTHILVKTTDLQVLIYDITTGETVYCETDVSMSTVRLYPHYDSVNKRLYLATSSSSTFCSGICIDVSSWTTLSRISGLLYFNEDTLEMYRVTYIKDSYETGIVTQKLPTATELATLAREFLGI